MKMPLCSVLSIALVLAPVLPNRVSAAQQPSGAKIREKVLGIPAGAAVEVRMRDKVRWKGRLGEVTEEGFKIQTAQGEQVTTQELEYENVRSIRQVGTSGHTGSKIAIGVLAGLGLLALVGLLATVASGKFGG